MCLIFRVGEPKLIHFRYFGEFILNCLTDFFDPDLGFTALSCLEVVDHSETQCTENGLQTLQYVRQLYTHEAYMKTNFF